MAKRFLRLEINKSICRCFRKFFSRIRHGKRNEEKACFSLSFGASHGQCPPPVDAGMSGPMPPDCGGVRVGKAVLRIFPEKRRHRF